jgi:hypothetical protein
MKDEMDIYNDIDNALKNKQLSGLLEKQPELLNPKLFKNNMTLGHLVATSGSEDDIKLLAKKGFNFNVINDDKMTPLALAVAFGEHAKVMAFIDNGASISVDGEKQSILIEAAFSGKDEIIDYLLEKGASVKSGDQVIDKNNQNAKAILKVISSINEASGKKDQQSFINYIKGERDRLGNDDVTKMVLKGIDDEKERIKILRSIEKSSSTQKEKESTKAALIFCWGTIDQVKLTKDNQTKSQSAFYEMAAKVYRAIAIAVSKVAKFWKKRQPESVTIASQVSRICQNVSRSDKENAVKVSNTHRRAGRSQSPTL